MSYKNYKRETIMVKSDEEFVAVLAGRGINKTWI